MTDENDHTPRFLNGSSTVGVYEVWLDESPAAPRDLLTVRAVDDDGHDPQQQAAIRYSLTGAPSMPAAVASRFAIEPDGRVLSTEELDYETAPLPDHTYRHANTVYSCTLYAALLKCLVYRLHTTLENRQYSVLLMECAIKLC